LTGFASIHNHKKIYSTDPMAHKLKYVRRRMATYSPMTTYPMIHHLWFLHDL